MQIIKRMAAMGIGVIASIYTGFPPLLWALLGVMSLDITTGLLVGAMGRSAKTEAGGLSSRTAFQGLMRKCMVLLVVLLAWMLDYAVAQSSGMVAFSAVTGMVCVWFIACEGLSILENAAQIGLPIPRMLIRMLETMRAKGEEEK